MNQRYFTAAMIVGGGLLLSAIYPFSAAASPVDSTGTRDSQEVSRLLKEAKVTASKLASSTDEFFSYTRMDLDWRTHADKADEVKTHVNALGVNLSSLEALQASAAAWQDEAIRSIRSILEQIADKTETVIQYIRDDPGLIRQAEYRDTLEDKLELAFDLKALTTKYVRLGDTKDRLEQLQSELQSN